MSWSGERTAGPVHIDILERGRRRHRRPRSKKSISQRDGTPRCRASSDHGHGYPTDGHGCLRCRTWESTALAGRGLVFAGITRLSDDHCLWRSGSHVQSGGTAHMGARPRPQATLLFRMIPRFSSTRSTRECATPITRACAGIGEQTHRTPGPTTHSPRHTRTSGVMADRWCVRCIPPQTP